jgi:predicted membrane protein
MNFIWSGLFWGVILVLFGLSIILRHTLNIDIPIFKIVFAIILIYFGVKLLIGTSNKNKDTIIFNKTRINATSKNDEYNIIFGSGEIDLQNIETLQSNMNKEINVVFGSGRLYLPKNVPVVVKVETVFGESKLPDGKTDFFGDYIYRNNADPVNENVLYLEVNVIFGSIVIEG